MWKNALLKALYYKGFSEYCEISLIWANFALTHTLPLENRHFLTKFSDVQKLKIAIYKGFRISRRQKYPKIRVLNCPIFYIFTCVTERFKSIPVGTRRAVSFRAWKPWKQRVICHFEYFVKLWNLNLFTPKEPFPLHPIPFLSYELDNNSLCIYFML